MSGVLDTRELLEELRALCGGDEQNHDEEVIAELDEDEIERMDVLTDLLDEIGPDAQYGVALIPEDKFEDHARELAEDIGAINAEASWPYTCIDWEQAANDLRMDYTSIEFDGSDYLYRA